MKVTVQSPYTAEVSIAQATAWLERNKWKLSATHRIRNCFTWEYASGFYIGIPDRDDYSNGALRMGEELARVAYAIKRPPADILREISEVVL